MAGLTRAQKIERLSNDPIYFLTSLWDNRKLNDVAPLSDLELDMVNWAITGPEERGILAPRGIGKTHLVPAVCSAYRLIRDPNRKILIPSKSATHAKKVVSIIRKWIAEVWFLQHLMPTDGVDSATQFQVGPAATSVQPSVTAIGIGGQMEGNRSHSIFPDDVETKENTETIDAREDLESRVNEFGVILYPNEIILDEDCEAVQNAVDPVEICYVGTYHAIPVEESLYVKLAKKESCIFRTWPVASPQRSDKLLGLAPIVSEGLASGKYQWTENEEYEKNPLFPRRFNKARIAKERKRGRTHFDTQMMLKCELGEEARFPLRLNDLIVYPCQRDEAPLHVSWAERTGLLNMIGHKGANDSLICEDIMHLGFSGDRLHRPLKIDTAFAPYAGTKAWIDPAGKGSDELALAIVAQLNGFLWVKAVVGFARGTKDITPAVILCRDLGVTELWFEDNIDVFGTFGQMLSVAVRDHQLNPNQNPMFPKGWKCFLQAKHTGGNANKEKRICRILEPVFARHRMVFDPTAIAPAPGVEIGRHLHLQEQITRITHQPKSLKINDKIDALASAVELWTLDLGVNTEEQAEATRERVEGDELDKIDPRRRTRRRNSEACFIGRA